MPELPEKKEELTNLVSLSKMPEISPMFQP